MIRVKHFMDRVSPADGTRLWVEPIGITRDLRKWCKIDALLTELAPPAALSAWFAQHPDRYALFQRRYQKHLMGAALSPRLRQLSALARRGTVTLLHQGDDAMHNSAVALAEILYALTGPKSFRKPAGRLGWMFRILRRDARELHAV